MATKYMKFEAAKRCEVHGKVYNQAVDDLTLDGYFCKDEVIEKTKMGTMEDSIRWDYIKKMIEDEYGAYELIPLAASFWKEMPKNRRVKDENGSTNNETVWLSPTEQKERWINTKLKNPVKYLATGHGKKTAGFGLVCSANGSMVIRALEQKAKVANGVREAARKAGAAAKKSHPNLTASVRALIE